MKTIKLSELKEGDLITMKKNKSYSDINLHNMKGRWCKIIFIVKSFHIDKISFPIHAEVRTGNCKYYRSLLALKEIKLSSGVIRGTEVYKLIKG